MTVLSSESLLPPVQATGAPAGSGQALPAGHAVQFSNFPPKEYIPAGHGTGGLLQIKCNIFISLHALFKKFFIIIALKILN